MDDSSSSTSTLSSPPSLLSRSPTPPEGFAYFNYPSPTSDLTSLGSTPNPEPMAATPPSSQSSDGTPAKKRRKLNPTPDREERHLDLSSHAVADIEQKQLTKLLKVLHKKRKIVVIAGAGISVSAGIPDFRSSTGLFKSLKKEHNLKSSGKDLFDAAVYKDGDSTTSFHAMIRNLSGATKTAQATPFHHMLATLAQENRLLRLYTQNVDGIDTSLPPLATQIPLPRKGPWPKTVQLHGTLEHMTCTKCGRISDFDATLFDGPAPPPCQHCEDIDGIRTLHAGKRSHGIGVLRPRMVLYNEHNPDDEAIGSVVKADMRTRPDALIVVGTTLKVPGVKRIVKEMNGIVRNRRDGVSIWINNDPPPALKDYKWDLVVHGPCDHVAHHACMRKWDDPEPPVEHVTDEQIIQAKKNMPHEVVINSPAKQRLIKDELPTPVASPMLKAQVQVVVPAVTSGKNKKQSTLAGTKRTGEGKLAVPPKKVKVTAKKKTAARKPEEKLAKLNFKVSKNIQPVAKTEGMKGDVSLDGVPRKAVKKRTPRKPKPRQEEPPKEHPLHPVSPSEIRVNNPLPSSPYRESPAWSPIMPSSPPVACYSPSMMQQPDFAKAAVPSKEETYRGLRRTPSPLKVNTSRESPDERRRVISPPAGSCPKGMDALIEFSDS